jgi:mannose-6-phosphate isomerase-like protein (cupin superfamily)
MTKIREFSTSWEPTNFQFWSERRKESIRGTARGKRAAPKIRPFDLLDGPNRSILVMENDDARVGFESVVGPEPHFARNIDFDDVLFQFAGTSTVESEMGRDEIGPGEMLVIPRGLAHRSVGSADCLRMFVRLHEPISSVLDESHCTGRSRYVVRREGAPASPAPPPVSTDPSAPVVEKMFLWDEDPAETTELEREYGDLVGVSSLKRDQKVSSIKKLRPFDLFTEVTGRTGPGPRLLASPLCIMEVYNTVGEQFAFHRALESEEFGLQFMGTADNMSEYDETMPTVPGDLTLIPLGIAHCVKDCTVDFRRLVVYSRHRFKMVVDPSMHVVQSRFTVTETVIEEPAWHAQARELASAGRA